MLKVSFEKERKNVAIALRERGRFFTTPFLVGASVAIFLHLCGWLLFIITPFKGDLVKTQIPPVKVAVESKVVIAHETPVSEKSPIPPSVPPPFPWKTSTSTLSQNPFKLLDPFEEEFAIQADLEPKKILTNEFNLSGELSVLSLKGPMSQVLAFPGKGAIFEVKIQNQTGKIFFAKLIEGKKELQSKLLTLQFHPKKGWITEGFVEVVADD
jgi:hypothetical protein